MHYRRRSSNVSTHSSAPQRRRGHPVMLSRRWKYIRERKARYVSGQDITNCKWLQYKDYIGNETRTIEFKHGGEYYMHNNFLKDVCIYGCAFLNSGGGSLLVGVCDDGLVCGVNLSHKMEDNTRLLVDTGLKNFHPPLLPHNYSLHFLPVIKQGKKEHGLKVVRLTFRAPTFTVPTLYQVNRGNVYMRRDGGVEGPLGVSAILEWSRQMWIGKVHQLEQQVSELISENRFLAGQAHELRQSIHPLHQIILPPLLQTEQTEDSPSIGQNLTLVTARFSDYCENSSHQSSS